MQKKICLLMVFMLTLVMVGCGSKETEPASSAAGTYLDMAQDFINKGDYESAINVLQKGYDTTGDEALNKAMQEAIAAQVGVAGVSEGPTGDFDYHDYLGLWANPDISNEGGYVLYYAEDISGATSIQITHYFSSSTGISAMMWHEMESTDFDGNKASFAYEDDWGSTGNITLHFDSSKIICDIVGDSDWGENGGLVGGSLRNYELISMPDVYDIIDTSAYEWSDWDYSDYSDGAVYDNSKASGILASLGMTEQEFRDTCEPLDGTKFPKKGGLCVFTSDVLDYPSNYIGHRYVPAYTGLDKSEYCIDHLKISGKAVSADGYTIYMTSSSYVSDGAQYHYLIFDYRDDIYSPTLSEGNLITPYMIFEGIQTINGTDWMKFDLICCDKP